MKAKLFLLSHLDLHDLHESTKMLYELLIQHDEQSQSLGITGSRSASCA
ncbi:hypothetical protein [Sphingobacterium griseoflavum]|nr:hypothetical protein [Sphingobacterium griseoflavum]